VRRLIAPLVLAATLAACGGGDASPIDKVAEARRDQAERVARDAGLPESVQHFLGDAAAGVKGTFTVVYRGVNKTTLVQRPPERRVDVVAGDTTESVIRNGDGTFACRRASSTAAWKCTRQSSAGQGPDPDLGVFSSERIAATVRALSMSKADYRFEVKTRTIAKTKATCLLTTPKAEPAKPPDELCFSKEGALLRVRSASQSLEAESYKATADAEALKLPAKPG
jgi:hypothetical protein